MAELRAGGMALIIGGSVPKNIGAMVELLFIVAPGELYHAPGGNSHINGAKCDVWIVRGNVITETILGDVYNGYAQISPKNLMPLDDEGEQVHDTEELPREITA